MAPPQVIPILVKCEIYLFRSPTYGLLVGAILAESPRPDFNNGPGDNLDNGRILAPGFIQAMASLNAVPIL